MRLSYLTPDLELPRGGAEGCSGAWCGTSPKTEGPSQVPTFATTARPSPTLTALPALLGPKALPHCPLKLKFSPAKVGPARPPRAPLLPDSPNLAALKPTVSLQAPQVRTKQGSLQHKSPVVRTGPPAKPAVAATPRHLEVT